MLHWIAATIRAIESNSIFELWTTQSFIIFTCYIWDTGTNEVEVWSVKCGGVMLAFPSTVFEIIALSIHRSLWTFFKGTETHFLERSEEKLKYIRSVYSLFDWKKRELNIIWLPIDDTTQKLSGSKRIHRAHSKIFILICIMYNAIKTSGKIVNLFISIPHSFYHSFRSLLCEFWRFYHRWTLNAKHICMPSYSNWIWSIRSPAKQ